MAVHIVANSTAGYTNKENLNLRRRNSDDGEVCVCK